LKKWSKKKRDIWSPTIPFLDKRFSKNNELVGRHWSGNEHHLICGIDVVNLLWIKGEECVPCDYRIYQSEEKKTKTKNEYFRDMLAVAKKRGFKPLYVLADCWYGSVENMKFIEKQDWKFGSSGSRVGHFRG
jgi:putative transposase